MTEKRFKQVVDGVKDTRTGRILTHPLEVTLKLNEINELYDCVFDRNEELEKENEQLKKQLESKEKAHTRCDELYWKLYDENEQLRKENKELRQDNDIKFWKLQCLQSSNNNQVMLFELSRVIQQGYEVSDKFKQYLDEIKESDKEIREKHKRLFE